MRKEVKMNNAGYGNYAKLIAFFLVAALLVVGFGFATEGWWQTEAPDAQNNKQNNENKIDIPASGNNAATPPSEPEPYIPEHVDLLTGEEVDEETSRKRHYAFVLDPSAPLYGISSASLVAEFPTESGNTRLVSFINNSSKLSKIGSLSPTRSYISNVAKFFASILVADGNDGRLKYDRCDMTGSLLDVSQHQGYCYTEYVQFKYTNGDLIDAGIYNINLNTTVTKDAQIPYQFTDFGKELDQKGFSAESVIIPHSSKSETELYFSRTSKTYSFNKNGVPKSDMLNDKKVGFKNIFILFTDTMTYEGTSSTEMVMNTIGSGTGYYLSNGVGQSLTWESDVSGSLSFYDESGSKLTINRGSSYLGFVKSAKAADVKIS